MHARTQEVDLAALHHAHVKLREEQAAAAERERLGLDLPGLKRPKPAQASR